jgi:hypothetical protein
MTVFETADNFGTHMQSDDENKDRKDRRITKKWTIRQPMAKGEQKEAEKKSLLS